MREESDQTGGVQRSLLLEEVRASFVRERGIQEMYPLPHEDGSVVHDVFTGRQGTVRHVCECAPDIPGNPIQCWGLCIDTTDTTVGAVYIGDPTNNNFLWVPEEVYEKEGPELKVWIEREAVADARKKVETSLLEKLEQVSRLEEILRGLREIEVE